MVGGAAHALTDIDVAFSAGLADFVFSSAVSLPFTKNTLVGLATGNAHRALPPITRASWSLILGRADLIVLYSANVADLPLFTPFPPHDIDIQVGYSRPLHPAILTI